MDKNLSNFKLWRLFNSTKSFKDNANFMKSVKFKRDPIDIQHEHLKGMVADMCRILEKHLGLAENSLPCPNILPNVKKDEFGKYRTDNNTIYIDFSNLSVGKLMHEFRHYIQYHFKEKSYLKGVEVPLPDPFYPLQVHEINAYNFQFLFDGINVPELIGNVYNTVSNAKDLFMLGYLNKETFDTERKFYKDYNLMCDFQNKDNDVIALYPEYRHEEYKINNYSLDIDFVNNKKFFTIKNDNFNLDFGIVNGKCSIYAINVNEGRSLLKEFLGRNKPLEEFDYKYKDICSKAIDFALNICKFHGITEIDINPCTPAVHKNKYQKILAEIKREYMPTDFDGVFNDFSTATPINKIDELGNIFSTPVISKSHVYIEQEEILNNINIEPKERVQSITESIDDR